ncbi:uncharacterized protein N7459_009978 [Penicillium hispanicum]|uniref:uncharacterized protein n=1 Tax=Penicillium hispanicum TaxID=1080232 RepID=UPI002540CC76|nr:uncharacterized protein N7459_009978 [Penicillium hispanicum]KAJ5570548.1 hypothetical protein N7459_009978 [Penicillium hispanicum]
MRGFSAAVSKASLLILAGCFLLSAMADAATKKSYFIRTKEDTSLETFQSWVQELDNGQGRQIVHDRVYHQSYVTNLTATEAEQVKQKDFILFVYEQGEPLLINASRAIPHSQPGDGPSIPQARWTRKSPVHERTMEGVRTLNTQQRFISWNQGGRPPIDAQYESDDNDGEGVDIYIIDTGFNLNLEELSGRAVRPQYYFVPNPNEPDVLPASIDDRYNHGTAIAVLAGGKTLGIAPKAGLYMVKHVTDVLSSDNKILPATSPDAIEDALSYIISKIRTNAGRKAVVNMSQTISANMIPPVYEACRQIFERFIADLDNLGVTFVVSAGNDGMKGETTAAHFPQLLGTEENIMLTIGGLNYDGTLWIDSEPQGSMGSITAYNLGVGMTMMFNDGVIVPIEKVGGTSYSAALTSGMIASLLGIKRPDRVGVYQGINAIYDGSGTRVSARETKAYVKGLTFERSLDILQAGSKKPPYKLPTELNSIYNGARGAAVVC